MLNLLFQDGIQMMRIQNGANGAPVQRFADSAATAVEIGLADPNQTATVTYLRAETVKFCPLVGQVGNDQRQVLQMAEGHNQ